MKSNSFELEALVPARDGIALSSPITLRLEKGELLIVQGDNGSGKSTLLRTIAGLLPPLSGTMDHRGDPSAILYIGHRSGMLPEMSVFDNVVFWARASGVPELASAAMHYFDLLEWTDRPFEQLSAGWQRRVALTRLITCPSGFWLLDEPTVNLDHSGLSLLESLIQTRLEQGGIIVLATHGDLAAPHARRLQLGSSTQQDGSKI